MKKLLGILVLGLLVCNSAYATRLSKCYHSDINFQDGEPLDDEIKAMIRNEFNEV